MQRPILRLVTTLAFSLALPMAAVAGTATLAPLGLPAAKQATQELKYSFGKDWENALRAEVKDDLVASKQFSDIVPEGGDLVFTLSLGDARHAWDDRMVVSGKGTLDFKASGTFSWKRGDAVVSEGSFEMKHAVTLDRQPYRTDLGAGWREVMRRIVQDAIDKGHAAGIFGADP